MKRISEYGSEYDYDDEEDDHNPDDSEDDSTGESDNDYTDDNSGEDDPSEDNDEFEEDSSDSGDAIDGDDLDFGFPDNEDTDPEGINAEDLEPIEEDSSEDEGEGEASEAEEGIDEESKDSGEESDKEKDEKEKDEENEKEKSEEEKEKEKRRDEQETERREEKDRQDERHENNKQKDEDIKNDNQIRWEQDHNPDYDPDNPVPIDGEDARTEPSDEENEKHKDEVQDEIDNDTAEKLKDEYEEMDKDDGNADWYDKEKLEDWVEEETKDEWEDRGINDEDLESDIIKEDYEDAVRQSNEEQEDYDKNDEKEDLEDLIEERYEKPREEQEQEQEQGEQPQEDQKENQGQSEKSDPQQDQSEKGNPGNRQDTITVNESEQEENQNVGQEKPEEIDASDLQTEEERMRDEYQEESAQEEQPVPQQDSFQDNQSNPQQENTGEYSQEQTQESSSESQQQSYQEQQQYQEQQSSDSSKLMTVMLHEKEEISESMEKSKSKENQKSEQELYGKYRQETGKRPLYNGKKTKGLLEWMETRRQESEEAQESDKEEEGIKELKDRIEQDNKVSKTEKKELIQQVREFNRLRQSQLRLDVLEAKQKDEELSEEERRETQALKEEFERVSVFQKETFKDFKRFLNKYDRSKSWGQNIVNWGRGSLVSDLARKHKSLKEVESNLNELINQSQKEMKGNIKENLDNNTDLTSETPLVLRLRNDQWPLVVKALKELYIEKEWQADITEENSSQISRQLVENIKNKSKIRELGYGEFSDFTDFHPQSREIIINLIRMTPIVLGIEKIKITDLYRKTVNPSARTMPNHYRNKIPFFFETPEEFYDRFNIVGKHRKRAKTIETDYKIVISGNIWSIVVNEIIELHEKRPWNINITDTEIDSLLTKLFDILKIKGERNHTLYTIFRNYSGFAKSQESRLVKLLKMTPSILNEDVISLVDLYRDIGINTQKSLPSYIKETLRPFFDTPEDYRAKFGLKTKEDIAKEFLLIATEKNWELMTEYVSEKVGIDIKCLECNHEWHVKRPSSLKDSHTQKGRGCPKCGKRIKYTIEDMKEIAQERGGWCLSEEYHNNKVKLQWKCGTCGNKWRATPKSIMITDSWCPQCAEGLYERMCRAFFEIIFGMKFSKSYPKWLLSEKGYPMHLDGFCKELGIAFEYQGRQHYEFIKFIHKTPEKFEERQRLDVLTRKLCAENDLVLIEIGFEIREGMLYKIKFDEMEDKIREQCLKKGIQLPHNTSRIDWKMLEVAHPDRMKEMRKLAKAMGGNCLSKHYFGVHTKLKWKCGARGHEFYMIPKNVKAGHWCPKCANKRRSEYQKNK